MTNMPVHSWDRSEVQQQKDPIKWSRRKAMQERRASLTVLGGASLTVLRESLLLAWWGVEYNGFKSKKINWINKDEKCRATEVSGKSSHHQKKKSLDLSILNVHIRWPANKFLIGLLYTNISQMESATDGEETPELKCHCLSPWPYMSHSALVPRFLHL